MKKKGVDKKTMGIFCIVTFVVGFFVGQFVHVPAFDDYNLLDAMRRPGSNSHRR